jgi:hypothetical protein
VFWPAAGIAIVTMSAANAMIEYFISNLTSQVQLSGPDALKLLGFVKSNLLFLFLASQGQSRIARRCAGIGIDRINCSVLHFTFPSSRTRRYAGGWPDP